VTFDTKIKRAAAAQQAHETRAILAVLANSSAAGQPSSRRAYTSSQP